MATVHMKVIWTMRTLIRNGCAVKEVAESLNVSEATVRKYTKAERKLLEDKKKEKALI